MPTEIMQDKENQESKYAGLEEHLDILWNKLLGIITKVTWEDQKMSKC